MTTVITPSPYLRDHLLAAARGLRKDAEAARLNLAEAEQDVAAARELLREAEAQEARARAAVDGLAREIAWAEEQAERRTQEIDAATAAHHAGIVPTEEARGFMPGAPEADEVPAVDTWNQTHPVGTPVLYWPGARTGPGTVSRTRSEAWTLGHGAAVVAVEGYAGGIALTHVIPLDEANEHDPDGDALPFNVVSAPADVIAALTGGTPTISPDDPPGEIVATHGPGTTGPLDPTVTAPDTGLAHPVPNPPGPDDGADRPRHAKPSRWTGGWPVIGRRKNDEQDGEA